VAANPNYQSGSAAAAATASSRTWSWHGLIDVLIHRWPLILVLLAGAGLIGWLAPRAVRALIDRRRRRRAAYLASEACAFAHLRAAAAGDDAGRVYAALSAYVEKAPLPGAPHTIASFAKLADDPALDDEVRAIERRLFAAPAQGAEPWSARALVHRVGRARRRIDRGASRIRHDALPGALNPAVPPAPPNHRWRPVAR
jgi:hypothetical protein